MKILLIEDDKLLRELLSKKISKCGYEIECACDGEGGLKMLQQNIPDLILLDIIMPRKSGFEVMVEMKKYDNLKNVPIIIVSNSGQPVEIDRARQMGVKDWIVKTEFDLDEVIDKIKKIEEEKIVK
jgi:two-component system alkaline phosphatase synthesis response regulator PhoP